jgi:hypothetical protein
LQRLPKDLAEGYTRVFEDIPENDRPFVRRALLWISGHRLAPWLVERGICASVLLSAIAYDLSHGNAVPYPSQYTLEDLEELCGCLITISPATDSAIIDTHNTFSPGADKTEAMTRQGQLGDPAELFVTLAHYTVVEFLSSSMIHQTSVSYFALSNEEIREEFATSVIRQALDADPNGSATDHIRDREAYCLTLACGLHYFDFSIKSDIIDLFVQYLNPAKPHYRRLPGIQKRLMSTTGVSRFYLVNDLVTRNVGDALQADLHNDAITILNMAIMSESNTFRRFHRQEKTKKFFLVHLSLIFMGRPGGGKNEVTEVLHEGTVFDIFMSRKGISEKYEST